MSWITNSIEREISESVIWMNTTLKTWEKLRERYHQGNIFRISDLQEEIYSTRQGDSSITQCFTILKRLWQEYDNFRPLPQYTCTTP